jgi:hypothetical protein
MSDTLSRFRLALGAVTIAGTFALAGCGPAPVSNSVTSRETTTITPAPMVMTTTTTDQTAGEVIPAEPAPRHKRYARHHPIHHNDTDTSDVVTKDTTVDTVVTPGPATETTTKSVQTTTTH